MQAEALWFDNSVAPQKLECSLLKCREETYAKVAHGNLSAQFFGGKVDKLHTGIITCLSCFGWHTYYMFLLSLSLSAWNYFEELFLREGNGHSKPES